MQNRRDFLSSAVGLAGLAACAGSQEAPSESTETRPPNIVFIMADDLGYGELGCYGQTKIRTPHIDKLASEGMKFSDAYAGCSVCAPARSCLMTGMHMGHTSVRSNPGGVPILPSDVTVAELLRFEVADERRLGESPADTILRICRRWPGEWFASGEFRGPTGLPRWSLQKLLGELVNQGRLERRGVTSKTRYRVVVTDDSSERT